MSHACAVRMSKAYELVVDVASDRDGGHLAKAIEGGEERQNVCVGVRVCDRVKQNGRTLYTCVMSNCLYTSPFELTWKANTSLRGGVVMGLQRDGVAQAHADGTWNREEGRFGVDQYLRD